MKKLTSLFPQKKKQQHAQTAFIRKISVPLPISLSGCAFVFVLRLSFHSTTYVCSFHPFPLRATFSFLPHVPPPPPKLLSCFTTNNRTTRQNSNQRDTDSPTQTATSLFVTTGTSILTRPSSQSPSRSNLSTDPRFVESNYHPGSLSSRSPAKVAVTLMSRRQKRHYLPQPAPRILQLPVRPGRRMARAVKAEAGGGSGKEKLGTLFEREKRYRGSSEGRVEMVDAGEGDKAWGFQEEVLRAECNVLRMEREVAVKKLRSSRLSTEKILRSVIQALIEGKKRISGGMNVELVINDVIENLVGKLGKLRRKTRVKESEGGRSCSNFDIPAAVGISDNTKKEIIHIQCEGDDEDCGNCKVELLRRKMEGLSKDVLMERMIEEYGSMLSMSKRTEWPPMQSVLGMSELNQNVVLGTENACSGHCRAVMRRIIEQVRLETEQWSQIQAMLGQVRDEMEELQASRDFWEDHALHSDRRIQSLSSAERGWRQKATLSEMKVNELQVRVAELQEEVERKRKDEDECRWGISREAQGEMEKRVLICHLRENRQLMETERRLKENLIERRRKVHASDVNVASSSRFPFKDIGNLSSRKNG